MREYLPILLSLFVCLSCSKKTDDSTAGQQDDLNDYPDIILRLKTGQEIVARELKGNNVFILFQPDCDHCQHEAIQVEQRLSDFKDYTIYFIGSAPMNEIVNFEKAFKLDSKENVVFAWTSTEGVLDNYGPIRAPSVYIYSDKRLKAYFNGQTDIENIINSL